MACNAFPLKHIFKTCVQVHSENGQMLLRGDGCLVPLLKLL